MDARHRNVNDDEVAQVPSIKPHWHYGNPRTVTANMTLRSGHCPAPAAALLLLQIAHPAAGLQRHRRQGRGGSFLCADGQRDAAACKVRSMTAVLRADFECRVTFSQPQRQLHWSHRRHSSASLLHVPGANFKTENSFQISLCAATVLQLCFAACSHSPSLHCSSAKLALSWLCPPSCCCGWRLPRCSPTSTCARATLMIAFAQLS